jgi:hypothetical protein
MNTTNILVGAQAANVLEQTVQLEETLKGDIMVLTDDYHLGPLHTQPEEQFSNMRMAFWKELGKEFVEDFTPDEHKIKLLLHQATKDAAEEMPIPNRVIFWMAPNAQDVCAYYWLLPYFQKYNGLLHVISIDSLPFFNEKGILYYPKNFAQILPKEMAKCKHLIKEMSAADYEVDIDEWVRISEENGLVRSHDVGKKISTRNETHFDSAIYLSVTGNFAKASKVLSLAMNKGGAAANEAFMAYRLKSLVAQESFIVQGDTSKMLKDFEIKSSKSERTETEELEENTSE